jgi:hypothetical protein
MEPSWLCWSKLLLFLIVSHINSVVFKTNLITWKVLSSRIRHVTRWKSIDFQSNIMSPSSGSKNKPSKIPAWMLVASRLYCSSKTSVDFQWTTWHYIPEDSTLHNHCCKNLKSYNLITSSIYFGLLKFPYCMCRRCHLDAFSLINVHNDLKFC